MTVRRKLGHDEGAAVLEFAWILPILLALLTVLIPLARAGWEYMVLSRATSHGVRYATKVDVNARCDGTVDGFGQCSGTLRRRPTSGEVDAYVRDAAAPVTVLAVSVAPDPSGSLPGETITVEASYEVSFGPLVGLANTMASLLPGGGNGLLPETTTVSVTARAREE